MRSLVEPKPQYGYQAHERPPRYATPQRSHRRSNTHHIIKDFPLGMFNTQPSGTDSGARMGTNPNQTLPCGTLLHPYKHRKSARDSLSSRFLAGLHRPRWMMPTISQNRNTFSVFRCAVFVYLMGKKRGQTPWQRNERLPGRPRHRRTGTNRAPAGATNLNQPPPPAPTHPLHTWAGRWNHVHQPPTGFLLITAASAKPIKGIFTTPCADARPCVCRLRSRSRAPSSRM